MEQTQFILVECGVDWMTCSARSGLRATSLAFAANQWCEERNQEGYIERSWNWNGYRGRTVDGLSVGTRDDGVLVRLSGSMSMRHWLSAMTLCDNVSRLDIQATILDTDMQTDWARVGFLRAAEMPRVQSGQLKTQWITSTPDGSTCSIGSRSSDRYLRLYDKTAETDGEYPQRCWRYEIEYKQQRARQVAGQLFTSRDTNQMIFSAVRSVFGDCGISVPDVRPTLGWRDAGYRHITDDERRLQWVARCIRPVIMRLVEAYDADTVMTVLGINPLYTVEGMGDLELIEAVDDNDK